MSSGWTGSQRRRRSCCAHVARETKRLKKNAGRRTKTVARQWVLTDSMVCVTVMCTVLADGEPDPGVVFLRAQGRQQRWPEKSDSDLAILVLDQFLASDVADLASLCDPETTPDADALARSTRLVEDWRVSVWTTTGNRKGVTPSTSSVIDEFERRRALLPEEQRPPCWGISSRGASRKKATRWRARFGGRMGVLRPSEDVPVEEMREKAPPSHILSNRPTLGLLQQIKYP